MSYGVTPQGFKRKTFDAIVADLQAAARNEFGSDVDLSNVSPLGKLINTIAYELSVKWQSSEEEYNSAYVDTAEGINLHQVGKYIGLTPQDQESDIDFRNRYISSIAKGGASTVESIRAKLLEVDGIRAAIVIENATNSTDADGRPAKSIECIVLGGNQTDIAKAILGSKAAGIQAYGSTTVTVQDSAGNNHTISFSYAAVVDIYANITITKTAAYPTDGDAQVKTAIIRYIGGTDGANNYSGLSMGDDVIYAKAIAEIYKIAGVADVVLELSVDGITYNPSNISIDATKVAETDNVKVVVTS
jgi:uncharacterized phage protein gp47/JayE